MSNTTTVTRTRKNIDSVTASISMDAGSAIANLIKSHLPQLDEDKIRDAVMNIVSAEIDHQLRFKVQGDIQLADYQIQSLRGLHYEK